MAPTFLFSYKEIHQEGSMPSIWASTGAWIPPRMRGGSVNTTHTQGFLFSSHSGRVQSLLGDIPEGMDWFSTITVYHCQGIFYAVPFDATLYAVGNGRQDSGDIGEGENSSQHWQDWKRIAFRHNHSDYTTTVDIAGEQQRLLVRRPDQRWMHELFPLHYHPQEAAWNEITDVAFGGLVGNLGLIIALIAFSAAEGVVGQAFRTCIVDQAASSAYPSGFQPHQMDPEAGRRDGRGIVISVFACPNVDSSSSKEALESFSAGAYGKIYY
ncbi:hypothetical protein K402DRAFT_222205 [Aulographum hederae CBS 113979]|uniref:Uncharacterized protein n=1 Tax=Aulographum hederae CBS 113979 TaxID=1176131 RepID=A0A6G1GLD8_9PEZI|nr:hypothetical protein K402DRAFT_222205 [Aulographum hederae CBS 113979]